jgi:thiamine kinase-like enzyme
VRLVDFEDSGRSDRAWELAIFTEHLSVHSHGQVPAELALSHFDTAAAEQARIYEYRRLLATFWLLMLLPGGPSHQRNPAGTLQNQALRLLELLD